MSKIYKVLAGAVLAVALAACGGGGGSAGTTGTSTTGSTTNTGTNTGTTGNTTTPSAAIAVSLASSSGATVSNIDASGGFVAKATVVDASGAAVSGVTVTFELSDKTMAALTPATALTNGSGVAQVSIAPAAFTSIGATSLKASATVAGSAVTGTKDFSVTPSNLALTALATGTSNLASGGTTSLNTTVTVNGAKPSSPVTVTFSTTCGRINSQTGSVSVTTDGNGLASSSYTAVQADGSLCTGSQTLTATAPGATAQSATVNVAAAVGNAITFVSASPGQIFVQGTGALEQSVVAFKVLSGTAPLANVPVTFSISVNPGGVGLQSTGSTTPVTVTSDSSGVATVSVFSGTIPGPVKVKAELQSNAAVFAETQNLTVASGPPSQRFMSLSAVATAIEGQTLDGASTTLTARLADRQGNAVQDGTVVNFVSEGGQIARSCATQTTAGISSCSVIIETQNPRPANGRVSVLAFASGTKDYTDNNGNNKYDAGTDTLINIGDAYRDDNENGIFDLGEFVVPRGGVAACAASGAPFPSVSGTCDTSLATTVRQQMNIYFAGSTAAIKNIAANTGTVSFNLHTAGLPLIPMPTGTTVEATTNADNCSVVRVAGAPTVNPPASTNVADDLSTPVSVILKGCASGNSIIIDVTAPVSKTQTSFVVNIP